MCMNIDTTSCQCQHQKLQALLFEDSQLAYPKAAQLALAFAPVAITVAVLSTV